MTLISSDCCPSWDIGNARFSPTQGSFRSLQLFGAGTHQVSWCSADMLQSVSCKKVVSPDTVWSPRYARVFLLFSASAQTDTGSKLFDCALVDNEKTFDNPENGWFLHICITYIICIIRIKHIIVHYTYYTCYAYYTN